VTFGATTIGWIAATLICVGAAAAVGLAVGAEDTFVTRGWRRYVDALDESFRALMLEAQGRRVARIQVALVVLLGAGAVVISGWLFLAAILCALGPTLWLSQQRRERVTKIEEQLDGWLQLLASALRASGGVGAAVESTATLVPDPLRQELDLVIKKTQLGVPLERALMEMGVRADSQSLSGALSTIVVGQRTGGDVPQLLETAAESLREMARLEGLIRAKTAQSKMQALVMALAPFIFVIGLRSMQPEWFDPLLARNQGLIALAVSILLWLAAVVLARKILDVEG
jgi:tight adherence protein B